MHLKYLSTIQEKAIGDKSMQQQVRAENIQSLFYALFILVFLSLSQLLLFTELMAEEAILPQTCLNNTSDEGQCKDCCDCLSDDADAIKSCRDSCATQDFSQNSDFIAVDAPSLLGQNGDYSDFLTTGSEQACKLACDSSSVLACGDKRYCRDACNTSYSGEEFFPIDTGSETGNQTSETVTANTQEMNIAQTLSDQAQMLTIAFDGLAFISGDMCSDSFLPPGKVADFSGFQYLRDNDPTGLGHNTDFVTIIAFNMLNLLSDSQIALLVDLAEDQIDMINEHGYKRFPLIKAFRRLFDGDLPTGTTGLSKTAVMDYSAELYRLDGQISYDRAETLGYIIRNMSAAQKSSLDALIALNGIGNWDSSVDDPLRELYPQLSRDEHVAVMTYASEMYSWYAGSVEADTYFCPERQGTYFGSFYMKDMPAMGNEGFTIPDNLTADMGDSFLAVLNSSQSSLVTSLVDIQRDALTGIVDTRTDISSMLRTFMLNDSVDEAAVLALAEEYGQLDGEIIYNYANNFSAAGNSLNVSQLAALTTIREDWNTIACNGAYLYSVNIDMPEIINTDFLFGVGEQTTSTSLLQDGAEVELIADGFLFAEGPAADNSGNLYFSDILANRIYQWSSTAGVTVFKENSGGANGLYINNNAELLAAEGNNKRIVALDSSATVTALAEQYNMLPFNEPNDLWATANNAIYFTDPVYNTNLSQDGEHVYYLSRQDNKVTRVVDDMVRPNGIIGTADGKTLYITDHGGNATYQYSINSDGSLSGKTLFASVGGDGMTLDDQGNLYIAAEKVLVYNSAGSLIESIIVPEQPTNMTFGGIDGSILFITTRSAVFSLQMTVSGVASNAALSSGSGSVDSGSGGSGSGSSGSGNTGTLNNVTPEPDIKVNGSDATTSIEAGNNVSITISLNVGSHAGQDADCWVWAETPFGNYSYVYPQGWQQGIVPTMQFPLANVITPFEVLGDSTLPAGDYQVHFSVDNNADGHKDDSWSDSIQFKIN